MRKNTIVRTVTFVKGECFSQNEASEAFELALAIKYNPYGDDVVKGKYNTYRIRQNIRNIIIEKAPDVD